LARPPEFGDGEVAVGGQAVVPVKANPWIRQLSNMIAEGLKSSKTVLPEVFLYSP
jgi:hypothetical protein